MPGAARDDAGRGDAGARVPGSRDGQHAALGRVRGAGRDRPGPQDVLVPRRRPAPRPAAPHRGYAIIGRVARLCQDWRSHRRFHALPARARSIVFYSESHQDWHHLQPLIDFLIERLGRTVCHVTSEAEAPLAARDGLRAFHVRPGAVRIWFFQVLKADVVVLTMPDLHNFQLKRSIHPVHYVYVFHNIGSTHMVDHAGSYDHYDTVFCVGPHHEAEIRRREHLHGLPPKHLFAHGYPRLDRLVEIAGNGRHAPSIGATTVLLAPTWGEQSILNVCGEALIASLLDGGVRVILRPHYQTIRLSPR